MMRKGLFSLSIALLQPSIVTVLADDNTPCTLCADESVPGGEFEPGSTCALFSENIGMTGADEPLCDEARLNGFKLCMCPTIPATFCSMCDYGSDGYVELPQNLRDVVIPGVERTCRDAEFPMSDDASVCASVPTAAWFCGCPNAERAADFYLCSDQSEPANGARMLTGGVTCEILNRAGGIGDFDFEGVLQQIPVDVEGYCGCTENAVAPATCNLCDGDVVNPDFVPKDAGGMTCDELNVLVSWVTQDDSCTTFQNDFSTVCCMELMPTPQPTALPTPANSMPVTGAKPIPTTPATTAQPAVSPTVPEPSSSSSGLVLSTFCVLIAPFMLAIL